MKTYYLTPWFMFLYGILSLSYAAILLVVFGYVVPDIMKFLSLLIGIVYTIHTLYKIRHEHITVTEHGVEFHSPWSVFQVDWSSLEKISQHWYHGWYVDCLVIDDMNVSIKKISLVDRRTSLGFFMSLGLFTNKTFIPLSCFSHNWRKSKLGQQIKQYAPHLFLSAEN